MKKIFLAVILSAIFSIKIYSQLVSDLPIPIAFASAEVWGDSIYFIGGSNNYSGTELYKRIYKYNGTSWLYYDSIPFSHVWGIESAIKGDTIYLFGGWSNGAQKLYSYRISTKTFNSLSNGPNVFYNYGHSLEYYNGVLYAFFNGYVGKYNIQTNTWSQGSTLSTSASNLSSTIYNGEIYLSGWTNGKFYKYNPTNDQWTELQSLPTFVSGASLRAIDNKIYLVGGSSSFSAGSFQTILSFDPVTNQWTTDSRIISSKRAYMEDIIYKNKFYILGGMDENSNAVKTVEYIMDKTTDVRQDYKIPYEFSLEQNFPNPFNPSTKISWQSPVAGHQTLKVYDVLGNEVAALVDEYREAGRYEATFDASKLSSGIYFYKFQTGSFIQSKKMTLLK